MRVAPLLRRPSLVVRATNRNGRLATLRSPRTTLVLAPSCYAQSHLTRYRMRPWPATLHPACAFSTAAADDATHTVPFLLADIGEGIKEVELLQWYVGENDQVRQFDTLCEVQSDKATVEITSRYDGRITRLCANVGDMVQVGSPLLFIDVTGEEHANTASSTTTLQQEQVPDPSERLQIPTIASHYRLQGDGDATVEQVQTSPAVRRLGAEYQLDLSTIHPSGPGGRLLKSDVVTYLKEHRQWRERPELSSRERLMEAVAGSPSSPPPSTSSDKTADEYELVQLRGYHRLMAKSMTEALSIPHMCFSDELVVDRLVEAREELKRALDGKPPSFLAFFIKAVSLALNDYPMVNSLVENADECQLRVMRDHNIGVAMDTNRGLVVPVLRAVNTKSLVDIEEELAVLKSKARENKLSADDLSAATFTLSNIGSIGGTYMQPVIVPPQTAMGAIGRLQRLPRLDADDNVYAAAVMHVSWAGDHRFLDGATLARFHAQFKRYLENPTQMLLYLK